MPSPIGLKRERPIVQVATETADAEGQAVKVWNNFATEWARVEFLQGRELEAMQKINTEISTRFTINYRNDVTEKMRLLWRNDYWNIHAILPSEDNFEMALMCSKVK